MIGFEQFNSAGVSTSELSANQTMEFPDDSGRNFDVDLDKLLPDDSGRSFDVDLDKLLPDDSGRNFDVDLDELLPDDSGRSFDVDLDELLPNDSGRSFDVDLDELLSDNSRKELDAGTILDDSGKPPVKLQSKEQELLSSKEIADKQDAEICAVQSGELLLDSDLKRGNFGEMKTDQIMRDLGYERISNDAVTSCTDIGHHGIDGVYFKENGHPQYIILDAKYGSAQLKMTTDGKQMSLSWIEPRLDQAIGKEAADKLRYQLFNPEGVGLYVCHVDQDGNTTLDKLDFDANVAERNVDLHDA